jgi:protease PrsW
MNYLFLIFFSLLPSIIWLFYYFKKDDHPEPKKLIFYVFIFGALFAGIGYFVQLKGSFYILSYLEKISLPLLYIALFYRFIIIAFTEELLKYLAFFFSAKGSRELDEPIDFIIYMITAGLGFAALENFIILSSLEINTLEVVKISLLRFLSGTLLHALVSGILGGFLAYAYRKKKTVIIFFGLITVTAFHGIYNILAERLDGGAIPFLSFFLFLILTLSLIIKKVKKLKSVSLLV